MLHRRPFHRKSTDSKIIDLLKESEQQWNQDPGTGLSKTWEPAHTLPQPHPEVGVVGSPQPRPPCLGGLDTKEGVEGGVPVGVA